MLQDALVVDDSVWENIVWGQPDATEREVLEAARGADGHEFITALPDGYRTSVGAHGLLLSGGQRERIAIARAMRRSRCADPAVRRAHHRAQRGIQRASAGPAASAGGDRTSIVVSHNLITVRDANLILLLDHGRIAESGTHAEVMHRDGGYASPYRLQQQRGSPVPQRESV
ncbi:hypothetical protein ACWDKQ_20635 [Saccharopolyspora sp. NPDC000995]